MKTKLLLTAIFATAMIIESFASHVRTALNLRMFDGRPISVSVNGVQNGIVSSQQEILNLPPGIHRLKIFAVQQHPFGWQGNMTQVFRGNVEVFDGFATYAVIHRSNSLVIENYQALLTTNVPSCPHPGNLPGYTPNPCGPQCPHHSGFQGANCSLPMPIGNNWNGGSNWGSFPGTGFIAPIHQNDFIALLRVIESKSFESTREDIAMGAIANNYFTSEQVRQMLNAFTFESTKVKVAKRAYDKVVDPDRYYVVYDSFTFESSIRSLQASLN